MSEKVTIYPGTFDPITNGHLSIVNRGLKIFDKLIIAILNNPNKVPLFSLEERIEMIPLGRPGTPEDVGELVWFLVSDKNKFINGQYIQIDGGDWL